MEQQYIIYLILLILLASRGIFQRGKTRAEYFSSLKMLLTWGAIILVAAGVAVYSDNLKNSKLYTALTPGNARTLPGGALEFSRSQDGHFHINTQIKDVAVEFMVDTGATGIALTKKDATRLGFDVENLHYAVPSSTANGISHNAPVYLESISINGTDYGNFPATVNGGELDTSLLGMAFLNTMQSYTITGDKLLLMPKGVSKTRAAVTPQ